jgi:tRNA(adenine34) deaminase
MTNNDIAIYLNQTLELAKNAYSTNEVPVGALIVYNNKIIATSFNNIVNKNDVTNHAEVLAIKQAQKYLKTTNLDNCSIFINLEPCLMCLGAIINSHIKDIYFSCLDSKKGAFTFYGINPSTNNLNIHYIENKDSKDLIQDFFKSLRN